MAERPSILLRYEPTSFPARAAILFVCGFVLLMAGILGGLWLWDKRLEPPAARQARLPEPLELAQPLQPSPGHPILPWEEMAAMREAQRAILHGGGPLPGDPAHQRIPIDEAMKRLLQSGALTQPWKAPATEPWKRPPHDNTPSVENRT